MELPTLTGVDLDRLRQMISAGDEVHFYGGRKWKRVHDYVLALDRYECQECKAHGRYSRANIVHHVNHLKDRPDLALSVYDDNGKRNLISVCKKCHEKIHDIDFKPSRRDTDAYTQAERWD